MIRSHAVISLVWYIAAKYAGPSVTDDIKMVIGVLQLPIVAVSMAISLEDSAAMKAGMFLPDEKKGEGASQAPSIFIRAISDWIYVIAPAGYGYLVQIPL